MGGIVRRIATHGGIVRGIATHGGIVRGIPTHGGHCYQHIEGLYHAQRVK